MIILDFGSGNTCRNDFGIVKRMIKELSEIDPRSKKVVIKWQLFDKAGSNVPLNRYLFAEAYREAWGHGYETTASVFDEISLQFLLKFNIPFVKLSNRQDLYWLADRINGDVPVIKSVSSQELFGDKCLCCVSEYPAELKQYEKIFKKTQLKMGVSDHTEDWALYKKFEPELYEVHYRLEDSKGLDAGLFARTPGQLREIL